MANVVNLQVDRGCTYTGSIFWLNNDRTPKTAELTGATLLMEWKAAPGTGAAFVSLSVGSGITVNTTTGLVTWTLTPTQVALITPTECSHALTITQANAVVKRLFQGRTALIPEF